MISMAESRDLGNALSADQDDAEFDRTQLVQRALAAMPNRAATHADPALMSTQDPFSQALGAVGRFAMIESVARQCNCSLQTAEVLLESAVDPAEEISCASMMAIVQRAVDGWQSPPGMPLPCH